MEFAPLDFYKTSYKGAPSHYKPYELGKYLLSKIIEKSKYHRSIKDKKIYLLIYSTDWKFLACDTLIALLQYWLVKGNHSFKGIFLLVDSGSQMKNLSLIFPTDENYFKDFDENKYTQTLTINLDPEKWELECK